MTRSGGKKVNKAASQDEAASSHPSNVTEEEGKISIEDIMKLLKDMDNTLKRVAKGQSDLEEKFSHFESKLKELEKSQQFISSQFDNFKITTDNVMKQHVFLQSENSELRKQISSAQERMINLEHAINDLEQYGRRMMIEISGIPKVNEENVEDSVTKICQYLNPNFTPDDIDVTHRVSSKDTANIIVKFTSRKAHDSIYTRRSSLRKTTTHDVGLAESRAASKIYINESLTKLNKELLFAAREFKKAFNYKYVWTRNGSVMLRQTESSKIIKLKDVSDLAALQ